MNELGISIITVSFNSSNTIEETIKSVLTQEYTNYEYIIIDGGSTDGTQLKIKKYESSFLKKEVKYLWVSEKDNGIYDAMNKGIKLATKEVIGIVNSDDWYEPNILKKINIYYKETGCPDIIHGNIRLFTKDNNCLGVKKSNTNYNRLWRGMTLKHPTFFTKRELYNSIGIFDTNYKISADYEFTLRAYINNAVFSYCDYVISNMRLGGVSNTKRKESWKEVDEIVKKYGLCLAKRKYYALRRIMTSIIYNIISSRVVKK